MLREEIVAYYAEASSRSVSVLLALMVVATIAYLWFVGVVRNRLGASENPLVGTVYLSSSVLFTGRILVGASALGPQFGDGLLVAVEKPEALDSD